MDERTLGRLRTAATLGVLAVILIVGLQWGLRHATAPFSSTDGGGSGSGTCTDRDLAQGTMLTPGMVTVSVLNAGRRDGLSSRTLDDLVADGFASGTASNAPTATRVRTVEIWTDTLGAPAVKLLRSYLGGADVAVKRKELDEPGINVVVGDSFAGVTAGRDTLTLRRDTTVCGP